MKKVCVFKVQGRGFLYKVMQEPVDYIAGGFIYRIYIGRKQCVKRIWTDSAECALYALSIVLGCNVSVDRRIVL